MSEHDWRKTNGLFPAHECKVCNVFALGEAPPSDAQPCPGSTTVFVRIDGEYELSVGEVWPDGDYPPEITAEAVVAAMKGVDLERDWNLRYDVFVSVGLGDEVRR